MYKKWGKSQLWHDTDRELQGKITKARTGFVDLLLEEEVVLCRESSAVDGE